MFAIFEDGSHQYRVHAGDKLEVDFRGGLKTGDSLSFERVLAAGTDTAGTIGRPLIEGASVVAEVLEGNAGKKDGTLLAAKLEVGKFKRRKGVIRHNGHVQKYTQIRVTAINVPGL
jgi:large subunit ribosomal protein L21